MVLVSKAFSVAKTNLYRSSVGQPAISAANNAADSPPEFCQNLTNIQISFLSANQALLASGTSPVPSVGDNLLTFMANRLSMSFANLGCQDYGLKNPVTVTLDGNGAATAAAFDTARQTASLPLISRKTWGGFTRGGAHGRRDLGRPRTRHSRCRARRPGTRFSWARASVSCSSGITDEVARTWAVSGHRRPRFVDDVIDAP